MLAIAAATSLSSFHSAQGAVWRVRKDGSGNFTTIQAGVNAMAPGDTCLIGPGVYPERVRFTSSKSGSAGRLTTIKSDIKGTVETFGFDTAGCSYLQIEGFNVSVPSTATQWPDMYGIAIRSSQVKVVSNYLHDVASYGIFGTSASVTSAHVIGNRLYKVGMGIYVLGTGWVVEGNEIERLIYNSANGDADYCRFFGSNHLIRSNYFHGTMQSEIASAHVDGFQTYDQGGSAQHIRIEANRVAGFYHQGCMLEATLYTNSYDIVICNNIFQNATSWGVCATRGIRDVQVYNNVFADIYSSGVGIRNGASGEVKNNIFYNVAGWDSATSSASGTKNLWFRRGASVGSRFNGDILNVDPKFADAANGDFRLLTGSPAIDRGAVLSSVTTDFAGGARPVGASWDLGAHEYGASGPASGACRLSFPRKSGANFVYTVTGEPGRTYSIEVSANLATWSQLTTVTLTNGTAQVSRPMTSANQFFRTRLLP